MPRITPRVLQGRAPALALFGISRPLRQVPPTNQNAAGVSPEVSARRTRAGAGYAMKKGWTKDILPVGRARVQGRFAMFPRFAVSPFRCFRRILQPGIAPAAKRAGAVRSQTRIPLPESVLT